MTKGAGFYTSTCKIHLNQPLCAHTGIAPRQLYNLNVNAVAGFALFVLWLWEEPLAPANADWQVLNGKRVELLFKMLMSSKSAAAAYA